MKLCVIGNSHVGMLRAAARDLGPDGPEITFFAKAGAGLDKATIRGSVMAANDPGLKAAQVRFGMPAEIDVSAFDAAIFVAGTASVYNALWILKNFRVSGWPSDFAPSGKHNLAEPDTAQRALVSEPAFIAALADVARMGISFRFAKTLRKASAVPMFLVPQPFPSERVFDTGRPREFGFLQVRRGGDGVALAAGLTRAIGQAFEEIGNVAILYQPKDTTAYGFTTAHAYTRDAVRVDGHTPQHGEDLLHVGPAYGRRVLDRVTNSLQCAPTP